MLHGLCRLHISTIYYPKNCYSCNLTSLHLQGRISAGKEVLEAKRIEEENKSKRSVLSLDVHSYTLYMQVNCPLSRHFAIDNVLMPFVI